MAITNGGTRNSIPAGKLPSGHTRETTTTFTDWLYKRELTLSVAKATVDESAATTTMTAIFENVTIGLDKQITDIVAADYIASRTVTTWAECTNIITNLTDDSSGDGIWMKNTAEAYLCTVILYIKTAA